MYRENDGSRLCDTVGNVRINYARVCLHAHSLCVFDEDFAVPVV